MSKLSANAHSYLPESLIQRMLAAAPFVPQTTAERMLTAPEFVTQSQKNAKNFNAIMKEINARRRFNTLPSRNNNTIKRKRTALNISNNIKNMNALQRNINRTVRNTRGGERKHKIKRS